MSKEPTVIKGPLPGQAVDLLAERDGYKVGEELQHKRAELFRSLLNRASAWLPEDHSLQAEIKEAFDDEIRAIASQPSAAPAARLAIDAKALQYAESFIKAEDSDENQYKDIRLSAMARELVRLSSVRSSEAVALDAERAWELARFDIAELDKPEVANAFGGELINALRSTFMRGFREGRSVPPAARFPSHEPCAACNGTGAKPKVITNPPNGWTP